MGQTSFTRRVFMVGFGAASASVMLDRITGKSEAAGSQENNGIFNSLDGSNPATTMPDPNSPDTDLGLANGLIPVIAEIEQTTRIPWFIVASYHTHILQLNGVDPLTNRDENLIGFTRDAMQKVSDRVFNSPNDANGFSLYASLEQEIVNRGRPFATDSVLGHALNLRQRFIDLDRNPISTGKLPNGLVDVYKFKVHSSIAEGLKNLLDQANLDGFAFGGWGARTTNTQVDARVRNGCGDSRNVSDMFKKSAGACRVPTAQPGLSMHERGLAVDFTAPNSEGLHSIVTRGSREDAYLMANAPKHGLLNLPSEAWHYSINGR